MFNLFKSKENTTGTATGARAIKPNTAKKDEEAKAEEDGKIKKPALQQATSKSLMEKYREKKKKEKEELDKKNLEYIKQTDERKTQYVLGFEKIWEDILNEKKTIPFVIDSSFRGKLNGHEVDLKEFVEIFLLQNYQDKCIAYRHDLWETIIHRPKSNPITSTNCPKINMMENSSIYVWPIEATNKEIKKYIDINKCKAISSIYETYVYAS